MADAVKYACSGFVNGHACTDNVRVRRDVLEDRLLHALKTDLLTEAIAQCLISPAPTKRLRVAEPEMATLPTREVLDLEMALAAMPRATDRYRGIFADPADTALRDVERTREVNREVVGESPVLPQDGHLVYEMGISEASLATLAGGASQIGVVAGARYRSEQSH
jgi:hypothetical protein